jgi:serine/threonine protein kinase
MTPVADHDLSVFYQFVATEKTPLLRSFFGCLAGALDFLHKDKIRHRDIKPQNILVKGSHVYLTDFGISLD